MEWEGRFIKTVNKENSSLCFEKNGLWGPKDRGNNDKEEKETGWRCMRNALSCFFLVFSIDLQKLSSELLLPRHTKLMASPGISTAHSNLLSFSVNSRSLKAMYHYRLYSLTQSQWALGVAAGKCWREVRACFNQQEGNFPRISLGRTWFACKAPFENLPSVWGR